MTIDDLAALAEVPTGRMLKCLQTLYGLGLIAVSDEKDFTITESGREMLHNAQKRPSDRDIIRGLGFYTLLMIATYERL